jgi:hypothetical protein
LEETNIKLSSIFADLMCKTGRAILDALAEGEENPEVLADLALRWAPHKRDALVPALPGLHEGPSSLSLTGTALDDPND